VPVVSFFEQRLTNTSIIMDISDNIFAIIAVAAIVNALLLYVIISIATKADRRAKYEWAQLELTAKIARLQGVPQEEIQAIFDRIK
jgi:hypothetical protein